MSRISLEPTLEILSFYFKQEVYTKNSDFKGEIALYEVSIRFMKQKQNDNHCVHVLKGHIKSSISWA